MLGCNTLTDRLEACFVCSDEAGERGSTHLILDSKGYNAGYGRCSGHASTGYLHSGSSAGEAHCHENAANGHKSFQGDNAHLCDYNVVLAGCAGSGDHAGGFGHAGSFYDFVLYGVTHVYAGQTVARHGREVWDGF